MADARAPDLSPLWRMLGRVRRRLRLLSASVGAVEGGIGAAAVLLMGTSAYRLGLLSRRGLWLVGAAAVLCFLGFLLGRALRRIALLEVAARIDESHDLKDRIGSALQFVGGQGAEGAVPGQALRELAVGDALRFVARIEPARAAPFARPPRLPVLLTLLLLLPAVAFLRLPGRRVTAKAAPAPAAPVAPRLVVEPEMIAPEREEVERLLQEARTNGDEDTKEMAEELRRLLDQIERGELSRKEAFDKIAELEQRLMQGKEGVLEELRERLRKAGDELGKDKLAKELGKALKQEDLEKAKKELQRLAQQAMKQKDKQALAQALKDASDRAGKDQWQDRTDAEKRQQQEQSLREEERRLKKKLEENPKDEDTARRLKKVQRELERLEREKQERQEAQRELLRLERDMQQAAEQFEQELQKMTPEQRKALEQLQKDMSRMQDEIRKLQKQNQGPGQGQGQGQVRIALGSLKQVLRRVARSGAGGPGGQGQGQQGQGQGNAQGQEQGQGKGKNPMKDFLDRAGGKGGQGDDTVLVEGEGGKGDQQMMVLGEGNDTLLMPGLGQKGPGQGQGHDRPGADGIGHEHDPNFLGDPTKLDARRRMTRVQGKEGAGPTRSQTILGSAEKGFSTQSYKKVYTDYTSVSEEVMSKERVPPGYRFYVKRYFQLIKPRE